jgi:hypothetical protein
MRAYTVKTNKLTYRDHLFSSVSATNTYKLTYRNQPLSFVSVLKTYKLVKTYGLTYRSDFHFSIDHE